VTLCSYLILDTLDDLFVVQLEDLYDVELRLTAAWPGLADAVRSNRLRAAFREHLHAAMNHVVMLEQIFTIMELDFHRKNCEVIQYLISQAEEVLEAAGDSEVKMAALIVVVRRIQHYKIAAYTSLRNLAQRSGRRDLVPWLQTAVESEIEADQRLTKIADFSVDRTVACSPA
jgi:ferritin-like metal-binding protein YciE